MEENVAETYLLVIIILYTELQKVFLYFLSVEISHQWI